MRELASQLVVVVDNSATNLKILTRLASSLGEAPVVEAFADPIAALRACAGRLPDLVVVAGEMAELDAASFTTQLHGMPGCSDAAIIVVAAYEERDVINRALAAGAADHVLSPVDHREFLARTRNLLRLRRYDGAAREEIAPLEAAPVQPTESDAGGLSRAHERLLRVIDAVPAMVCATDRDGRYIFCNQRFAEFAGLRPGRLIGRRPVEVQDDALARRIADVDARLLDGEMLPLTYEEEATDRDGHRCDLLTTKTVHRDGDGAMVVTVAIDITAQKQVERDLVAVKEQAEIANRSKTEFLGNMSHELRTPLNAIIGFSQVMASEMLGPITTTRYVDYARDILASAEHLHGIIGDMLDVAKLETGTLDLAEEMIDLPQAIGELIALIEPKARVAELRVIARRDGEVPRLRGDPRKVKQIVLALLTNAIKFSRPSGEVEIVLRGEAGAISITVVDRGIGMEPHEVELAMTRFGQTASPWTRRHAGTGLGLPLAIGLAELHGGTLTVQSIKGVGTTATVAFPARRSEIGPAAIAIETRTAG
jgi:PAS domain S-box-containing protein